MPLDKVTDLSPNMGCDPEFFFRAKGKVVGAETIIPPEGIVYKSSSYNDFHSKFIIDGVQAELNPRPNTCRANLGNEIKACFRTLNDELKKRGQDYTADFSRTVTISKQNLMALDEKSRKFGCAPSQSIYKKASGLRIDKIDPSEYRVRAAGGHIHIGHSDHKGLKRALVTDHERTVAMLDILCGNTSVLIDRDKGNIERRKVYGRAGEYRLPKHGLEYRTLSNYWLTSYPLMSLAFGMARLAVNLMAEDKPEKSNAYFKEFISKVKTKNIHNAINYNDFDLAMENFQAIEPLIKEVTVKGSGRCPLHEGNLTEFYHFVKTVKSKGLEHWFKQDPMTHWIKIGECHTGGFHDFLLGEVHRDMKAKEKKVA